MTRDPIRLIPADFTPVPSLAQLDAADVQVVDELGHDLDAIGVIVHTEGDVPEVALDREALARVGFEAKPGQTLVLPQPTGPTLVAVGAGAADEQTDASLRDAAAAFVRAVPKQASSASASHRSRASRPRPRPARSSRAHCSRATASPR
ncbi:M17 family peptidase N-terminal domain-containing protein [Agromyces mangrovi Wang et al. 2018]|uniref:M17 family peptidase N-terminal domain-containing protein n=1 Tax=Agromyces mangrovi TaxID=1858653 RepID=UPI0025726BE7|nr:M17 family peptidase N-terminal domain-containing protein [Agromyces mangrovi]BDZ64714.1 hypothetical protein GCM10025877_16520 [Agromyces mangrovi]